MNRFAWVVLAALLMAVVATGCNGKDKKGTKVVVVDEGQALKDSGLAKSIEDNMVVARDKAAAAVQKALAQLRAKAEPLQAKRDELIKAAQAELRKPNPSTQPANEAQALNQKLAALEYLGREADQIKVRVLQKYQQDLVAKLRNDIQPTLQTLAASKGADVILVKAQAMYAEPTTDITQDLVKALTGKSLPQLLAVPEEAGKDLDLSEAFKKLEI